VRHLLDLANRQRDGGCEDHLSRGLQVEGFEEHLFVRKGFEGLAGEAVELDHVIDPGQGSRDAAECYTAARRADANAVANGRGK
jgi:hypothetical protein